MISHFTFSMHSPKTPHGSQEMTANIPRMQKALGLEKQTTGEQVRDYLRKMSCLGDGAGDGFKDFGQTWVYFFNKY